MNCKNCGKELEEEGQFCEACGAKVPGQEEIVQASDTIVEASDTKKSGINKKAMGIGIGSVLLVLLISLTLGLGYSKNLREKNNLKEIETMKNQEEQNIKNEQLLNMQAVLDLDHSTEEYIITEVQKTEYDSLLEQLKQAIDDKDTERGEAIVAQLEVSKENFVKISEDAIAEKVLKLEAINMAGAFEIEWKMVEEHAKEIDLLLGQKKYFSANEVANKWEMVSRFVKDADQAKLAISQVDVANYPKVTLYLQMQDLVTGQTIDIADLGRFSLMENQNGIYKETPILNATQLNEKEKLNINLTADMSGSMIDEFDNVKSVMKNFLDYIQFHVGDAASLVTFDNNISIDVDFTSTKNTLIDAISNMQLGNMTALYDALYVSVSKTATQEGAKCVIAFTDGHDNYSVKTADEVIQLAQAYKIPVFIIGIGQNVNTDTLSHIANSTGGFYENVSSGISMETIYNEIYHQQKELYLLEYQTDQTMEEAKERNLYITYKDESLAIRSIMSFVPKDLMKQPEDYKNLINKSAIDNKDIEAEILRIRAIWNADREAMQQKQYKVTEVGNGIKAFSKNNDIRMIEIQKNINGVSYARTYNFSSGKLIFAYIESNDAHRLYFKDDTLFRWRYTLDAKKRDQAVNYDNIGDSEEFNQWERFALEEGYQVYEEAMQQ
ncbi:MAG TPA: VWA domain-containing protein [Epulopiscium sp.]|nr:VWA domain-containing protein [Candidatus Epulonipiscium sp.]